MNKNIKNDLNQKNSLEKKKLLLMIKEDLNTFSGNTVEKMMMRNIEHRRSESSHAKINANPQQPNNMDLQDAELSDSSSTKPKLNNSGLNEIVEEDN